MYFITNIIDNQNMYIIDPGYETRVSMFSHLIGNSAVFLLVDSGLSYVYAVLNPNKLGLSPGGHSYQLPNGGVPLYGRFWKASFPKIGCGFITFP